MIHLTPCSISKSHHNAEFDREKVRHSEAAVVPRGPMKIVVRTNEIDFSTVFTLFCKTFERNSF